MKKWLLSDFDYHLPKELIAQYPLKERSASRLLYANPNNNMIRHRHFSDVLDYIEAGDLLIFNDSRVIPARLQTRKDTGGAVEVLLERIISRNTLLAHVGSNKKLKEDAKLEILNSFGEGTGVFLTYLKRAEDLFLLRFSEDTTALEIFEQYGHMPLPPYMHRQDEESDKERYQTVYAKYQGSVAAPTAGLHFDQQLLNKLKLKGVEFAYVTLHVGSGTFKPVKVDDISQHKMHSEIAQLSEITCEKIKQAKASGKRVITVGTTATRTVETAVLNGVVEPFSGETNIFIYPGFEFKCVDAMITNFHLPQSTLLMMVSAFAGRDFILNAYKIAIEEGYRFFSYGDAMFVEKKS